MSEFDKALYDDDHAETYSKVPNKRGEDSNKHGGWKIPQDEIRGIASLD